MRLFFVALLGLLPLAAFPQNKYLGMYERSVAEPLDLDMLQMEISTPLSKYFYPVLVERYNRNDTTMTRDEFRRLYYGYAYSDNYLPYAAQPYADSVAVTLLKDHRMVTVESSPKLIYYIGKVLEKEPFNIEFINLMSYIHGKLGDEEGSELYSWKLDMILEAIFSSGTGLESASPFMILYRSDVNSILSILGTEATRRAHVTKNIEYYRLRDRIGEVKAFYFDFILILKAANPTPKQRRFEFNPYYNPKSELFINRGNS